jgi:hypothetical protein
VQQDGQEFMKLFLTLLEARFGGQHDLQSLIQALFRGQSGYRTTCQACGRQSGEPAAAARGALQALCVPAAPHAARLSLGSSPCPAQNPRPAPTTFTRWMSPSRASARCRVSQRACRRRRASLARLLPLPCHAAGCPAEQSLCCRRCHAALTSFRRPLARLAQLHADAGDDGGGQPVQLRVLPEEGARRRRCRTSVCLRLVPRQCS